MNRTVCKSLIVSVVCATVMAVGATFGSAARGQSGLYIPSAKPIKNMKTALEKAETFCLLLHYEGESQTFTLSDLDLLDSAYRIAFGIANPMYYTMNIEGYGGDDEALTRSRVEAVHSYFAKRSGGKFPVRVVRNPIHCSCNGDTVETLRYEVPVTKAYYNTAELPEARRLLNKSVPLGNSVLVTFQNNPDECVGAARGCAVPSTDSVVHGYYASLKLARGSLWAVEGTKDTCPSDLVIKVEDHLDFKDVVERYKMVPHKKQLIVQAGYIVLSSNWDKRIDSCQQPQPDSIFVRIPVSQLQLAAKLKFYAKVMGARGLEYKALPTRKAGPKTSPMLQAPINATQFDTIYIGKRIQEDELKKYFYPVDGPTEAASFKVGDRYFVAYRPGKHGGYELKEPLMELFREIPEQEQEKVEADKGKRKKGNPDEEIAD